MQNQHGKSYANATVVKCRSQYAVNFTVDKEYDVVRIENKRIQTQKADKFYGLKDEYTWFITIYMIDDTGNESNQAEYGDFEVVQ